MNWVEAVRRLGSSTFSSRSGVISHSAEIDAFLSKAALIPLLPGSLLGWKGKTSQVTGLLLGKWFPPLATQMQYFLNCTFNFHAE